jgi:hypothetical protein
MTRNETSCRRYGDAVPVILLLAAVLAAEEVSFVLVGSAGGSAGLCLHGERLGVGDIDAVPAPGWQNLETLHAALADMAIGGRVPPLRSLASAVLVSVRASYGKLDCLMKRGRRDWDRLHPGAGPFCVAGVQVLAAGADDIRSLRVRFKGVDDD